MIQYKLKHNNPESTFKYSWNQLPMNTSIIQVVMFSDTYIYKVDGVEMPALWNDKTATIIEKALIWRKLTTKG